MEKPTIDVTDLVMNVSIYSKYLEEALDREDLITALYYAARIEVLIDPVVTELKYAAKKQAGLL